MKSRPVFWTAILAMCALVLVLAACASKPTESAAGEAAKPSNGGGPGEAVNMTGDATKGAEVYTANCVTCHGPEGKGNGPIPSLWGPTSYSIGASMAREERAASFIWHNMPQTAPGTLTPQQAFDLAAFINSHPRPDSPGKEQDWPMGGAPKDVPYSTSGRNAHRPPASLVPRGNPQGALVPNPAPVGRRGR
jgi:thiosulfate dehydrogenase